MYVLPAVGVPLNVPAVWENILTTQSVGAVDGQVNIGVPVPFSLTLSDVQLENIW